MSAHRKFFTSMVIWTIFMIMLVSIVYAVDIDTDRDGVPNDYDKCGGSNPDGVTVDSDGCSCAQLDCESQGSSCEYQIDGNMRTVLCVQSTQTLDNLIAGIGNGGTGNILGNFNFGSFDISQITTNLASGSPISIDFSNLLGDFGGAGMTNFDIHIPSILPLPLAIIKDTAFGVISNIDTIKEDPKQILPIVFQSLKTGIMDETFGPLLEGNIPQFLLNMVFFMVRSPEIYLYPTEPTLVDVTVGVPAMAATVPAYDGHWSVHATPNGVIDNSLHYLFYQPLVSQKPIARDGYWVIAQEDLGAWFDATLPLLGLSGQESTNYASFWLPQLDAPYYKIAIADSSYLNTYLPLYITPEPDTTMRVMLLFTPLSGEISAHPPVLSAVPPRNGFVVVETGGDII